MHTIIDQKCPKLHGTLSHKSYSHSCVPESKSRCQKYQMSLSRLALWPSESPACSRTCFAAKGGSVHLPSSDRTASLALGILLRRTGRSRAWTVDEGSLSDSPVLRHEIASLQGLAFAMQKMNEEEFYKSAVSAICKCLA